jgi:uncharacterized protein YcnI
MDSILKAIAVGDISKAKMLTMSKGVAPLTNANRQKLRALFKTAEEGAPPQAIAVEVDPALTLRVEEASLIKHIKGRDKYKAPDIYGYSNDLLQQMLVAAGKTNCISEITFKKDLAIFIQAIVNGDIERESAAAREVTHAAKGTALWKQLSPSEKIRPISAPSIFYAIAQALQLDQPGVITAMAAAMGPTELAYKVAGASEILSHAVQMMVESHPGHAFLHMDVRNAFGSLPCQAAAEAWESATQKHPGLKPLSAMVRSALQPGRRVAFGHLSSDPLEIRVDDGLLQGEPSSMPLFCITLNEKVTSKLLVEFPTLRIMGPADDKFLMADAGTVIRAYKRAVALLAETGLEVQMDKCELWAPMQETKEALRTEMQQQEVNVPITEGIMAAGAPVGEPQFIRARLKEKFDDIVALIRRLGTTWSMHKGRISNLTQATFQILSYCIAPASVNYLLRTVRPRDIAEEAARFDEEVEKLTLALAQSYRQRATTADRAEITRLILHLPMAKGGLGLASAAKTSKAAYWSAGMETAEAICTRLLTDEQRALAAGGNPGQFNQRFFPLLTELVNEGVHEQGVEVKGEVYKMKPHQVVRGKVRKLQKGLVACYHKHTENAIFSALQREGVSPMRVQQFVSGQGDPLHALQAPTRLFRFPNEEFSAVLADRLQLPFLFDVLEGQPQQHAICCKCERISDKREIYAIDPSGEHGFRCTYQQVANVMNKTRIHNEAVRALENALKPLSRCRVLEGEQRIEWQRKPGQEGGERFSDMAVIVNGHLRHVDVTFKALLTSADDPPVERAPRRPPAHQVAAAAAAAAANADPAILAEDAAELAEAAMAAVAADAAAAHVPVQQIQAAVVAAAEAAVAAPQNPDAIAAAVVEAARAAVAAEAAAQEQRKRERNKTLRMHGRAAAKGEKEKQAVYGRTYFIPDPSHFFALAFEHSGTIAPDSKEQLKSWIAELVVAGGDKWMDKTKWTEEDKKAYGAVITRTLRGIMVAINIQKGKWLLEMEKRMRNPEFVRWPRQAGPPQAGVAAPGAAAPLGAAAAAAAAAAVAAGAGVQV